MSSYPRENSYHTASDECGLDVQETTLYKKLDFLLRVRTFWDINSIMIVMITITPWSSRCHGLLLLWKDVDHPDDKFAAMSSALAPNLFHSRRPPSRSYDCVSGWGSEHGRIQAVSRKTHYIEHQESISGVMNLQYTFEPIDMQDVTTLIQHLYRVGIRELQDKRILGNLHFFEFLDIPYCQHWWLLSCICMCMISI